MSGSPANPAPRITRRQVRFAMALGVVIGGLTVLFDGANHWHRWWAIPVMFAAGFLIGLLDQMLEP